MNRAKSLHPNTSRFRQNKFIQSLGKKVFLVLQKQQVQLDSNAIRPPPSPPRSRQVSYLTWNQLFGTEWHSQLREAYSVIEQTRALFSSFITDCTVEQTSQGEWWRLVISFCWAFLLSCWAFTAHHGLSTDNHTVFPVESNQCLLLRGWQLSDGFMAVFSLNPREGDKKDPGLQKRTCAEEQR